MTPTIDGKVHHFQITGLYDGVAILADKETGSIWNHLTGQSVYGPLMGRTLPLYNLIHSEVGALRSNRIRS